MKRLSLIAAMAAALTACSASAQDGLASDSAAAEDAQARAYFAMGCFWCGEADFEKLDGVYEAVSGYAGGHKEDPNYEEVTAGGTGHYEAVRVSYDPAKLSYQDLLNVFWRNVDPFDAAGQFCDKGESYRAAIFPKNAAERAQAEASLQAVKRRFDQSVATRIVAAPTFYPAEDYHQDYYKKNPIRYKFYRTSCGRDDRLEEVWGS